MSVLMNVVSIWRSRSGLAWASCSCRKRAGSILLGAVIAFFSWVSVEGHPEDHAVAASTFRARYSPGPSYTTLADATKWARPGSNPRPLACKQDTPKRCADLRLCCTALSIAGKVERSLLELSADAWARLQP